MTIKLRFRKIIKRCLTQPSRPCEGNYLLCEQKLTGTKLYRTVLAKSLKVNRNRFFYIILREIIEKAHFAAWVKSGRVMCAGANTIV